MQESKGEHTDYLIVGIGNPGAKYEKTRHNLGFMVVHALAKKFDLSLEKKWRIEGEVARGTIRGKSVHLLTPTTYVNLSGKAVTQALTRLKIDVKHLLVVVDEYHLPFGKMRIRPEGGSSGHNGLRDIERRLGTQGYSRLRMGIGPTSDDTESDGCNRALEEYVLDSFTDSERKELPHFLQQGADAVEVWIEGGIEPAIKYTGELYNSKVDNERKKTTL